MYEGVHLEVLNTTRFDESSDLSMAYSGRTDMTKTNKVNAEETFFTSDQGYTEGKLLDGTECRILMIKKQRNHICLRHTISDVNHFRHCQCLHQKHKEYM